jgi:type I restriction enzyme, S subunit
MSDTAIIDWDVKPLSQLAEARRGITYSSAMLNSEEGGLPYINMKSFLKGGGFNVDGTKRYAGTFTQQDVVGERDLLIANTDVTAGDIIGVPALLPEALAAEQVLYSHHVTRLRINGKVTVPFLYYLLCLPEYRSQMLRIARGTTVLMLDMPAIKRITICVPKNEVEQNRIVKILSTLDKAIEKTEALIAKYQQIKAGLMHDLFTRGFTADGKLRPPREQAPELYQETPIGWIPKEWGLERCGNLCTRICVGIVIQPTQYYVVDGVPAFRSANVREDGLDPSNFVYISPSANALLAKSQAKTGDILSVRTGYPGTSAVVPREFHGFNCIDILISSPSDRINSEFLCDWINSSFGKEQVLRQQGGMAQQHFNVGEMRELLVVIPSNEEQTQIRARAIAVNTRLRLEKDMLLKFQKQKLGLMHDLLTGKVRVKTDSKTLERIGG